MYYTCTDIQRVFIFRGSAGSYNLIDLGGLPAARADPRDGGWYSFFRLFTRADLTHRVSSTETEHGRLLFVVVLSFFKRWLAYRFV
jgi:hypothetical protein